MAESDLRTQFTNGSTVHFAYDERQHSLPSAQEGQSYSRSKSKKKKKKKNKSAHQSVQTSGFFVENVKLANPNADYPESRSIKADSNGNLIVESLEETNLEDAEGRHSLVDSIPMSTDEVMKTIAMRNAPFRTPEETEFWLSLSKNDRDKICSLKRADFAYLFDKRKQECLTRYHETDPGTHYHETPGLYSTSSACKLCNNDSMHIQSAIEGSYDVLYDDLVPMYDEYRRLLVDGMYDRDTNSFYFEEELENDSEQEHEAEDSADLDALPGHYWSCVTHIDPDSKGHQNKNLILLTSMLRFLLSGQTEKPLSRVEKWNIHDSKAILERILPLIANDKKKQKLKDYFWDDSSAYSQQRSLYAHSLIETLYQFSSHKEEGLAKAVDFVSMLCHFADYGMWHSSDVANEMSQFADGLLKEDGRTFIDIIVKIKESLESGESGAMNSAEKKSEASQQLGSLDLKTSNPPLSSSDQSDSSKFMTETSNEGIRHADRNENLEPIVENHANSIETHSDASSVKGSASTEKNETLKSVSNTEIVGNYVAESGAYEYQDRGSIVGEDYYETLDNETAFHGWSCGHTESDPEHDYRNLASLCPEALRYWRHKELLNFFLLRCSNFINQRFREAFEKRISEVRRNKFIAELEAEEQAKKEKELKKNQQKEKQKEKKRLQQLEKEEKRKKKEAEELEKVALQKEKEEKLRAEQIRRKEEIRLKREAEKLKKIEAMKEKEIMSKTKTTIPLGSTQQRSKVSQQDEKSSIEETRLPSNLIRKQSEDVKNDSNGLSAQVGKSLWESVESEEVESNMSETRIGQYSDAPRIDRDSYSNNNKNEDGDKSMPSVSQTATEQTHVFQTNESPTKHSYVSPSKHGQFASDSSSWTQSSKPAYFNQAPASDTNFDISGSKFLNSPLDRIEPPIDIPPISTLTTPMWKPSFSSRTSSIWGPQSSGTDSMNLAPLIGQHSPHLSPATTFPSIPNDSQKNHIHSAAFEAIRLVENGQYEDSSRTPVLNIFQLAKVILQNPTITLSEFLQALNSSTKYNFSIIYDDFGSAIDIKASVKANTLNNIPSFAHEATSVANQTIHPTRANFQHASGWATKPVATNSFSPRQNFSHIVPPSSGPLPFLSQNASFGSFGQRSPSSSPFSELAHNPLIQDKSFGVSQKPTSEQGEKPASYDLGISEAMQGSLSKLGIGQVKGGIW